MPITALLLGNYDKEKFEALSQKERNSFELQEVD